MKEKGSTVVLVHESPRSLSCWSWKGCECRRAGSSPSSPGCRRGRRRNRSRRGRSAARAVGRCAAASAGSGASASSGRRRRRGRGPRGWGAVEKVPYEYGVVVRAGDDLELVELEPEHPAGVLDKGADTEGARRGTRIKGSCEVPNLKERYITAVLQREILYLIKP